jgi:3-oxoacyl-[acyl-carrier protein] reductase
MLSQSLSAPRESVMTKLLLEGKVAIVTGAGAGVGEAIANRLAASGAYVVVNDIDGITARRVEVALSEAGSEVAAVVGSVANPKTAVEMVQAARDRWGRLDILVNSANVTRDAMIHLLPDEWFAVMMDVIVKGTFQCIRAAAPLMCTVAKSDRSVDQRVRRKIVNIASTAAIYGAAGKVAYAAATAAVIGMTKTVAKEWAPFGVKCNAVAPGLIAPGRETANGVKDSVPLAQMTPPQGATQEYGLESLTPEFSTTRSGPGSLSETTTRFAIDDSNKTAHPTPLGRIGTPDDVAGAVAFLVGPDSDFITGTVLEVQGGMEAVSSGR